MSQWKWWQDALKGVIAPIDPNEPQTGYYRVKRKGHDGFAPVAYWRDSKTADMRCQLDGQDLDELRALELWPYASKRPVSFEAYTDRMRNGRWPDESEAVTGHNRAPVDDSIEAIRQRVDDLALEAERLIATGAAASEDAVNQASDLANTLGELETKADKLRADEKAPHVQAGRAVDSKWRGLIDRAQVLKQRLKAIVVLPFLQARAAAVENARQRAIAAGAKPEELPAARTTAGTAKRSTALRTQVFAEVTNWDSLVFALRQHPDIRETAQRIANASAKAGIAFPGTTLVKKQVAA